jgi:hypothetical protein
MITLAHQEHPEISIEHLCELLEVSRSWYYEHSGQIDPDPQDIALRDEIERIILEEARIRVSACDPRARTPRLARQS